MAKRVRATKPPAIRRQAPELKLRYADAWRCVDGHQFCASAEAPGRCPAVVDGRGCVARVALMRKGGPVR